MPKNIDEYRNWLKERCGVDVNRAETRYKSVVARVKQEFEESGFWVQMKEHIGEYGQEYWLKTGYHLFAAKFKPELHVKTFESFLLKTFRKNFLENKRLPNEPADGWILPSNGYGRINDIVRTLFVVRYFDGVEFLIDKIRSLSTECNVKCHVFLEAREEGYYAAHLNLRREFEIPKALWDTEKVDIAIEIQITTQVQEVIRKLLHKYYEKRRMRIEEKDVKWQWDYKCDEFSVNYLGHILHYVEGMILEIREKQRKEKT